MPAVLITGANRGIGLEFARQYSQDGWNVIATVRDSSPELDGLGVRVERLDMRDLDAVEALGGAVEELDLLIANAGTYGPKSVESASDGEDWAETFKVNTIAPFLLAQSLVPQVTAKRGKLIGISTQMGSIEDNSSGGFIAYRSSKAALNAAWKSLALDLRSRGVAAAVFHPGWVQTRMGGESAPMEPQESVSRLRRLIEDLSVEHSGRFFSHDGSELPW